MCCFKCHKLCTDFSQMLTPTSRGSWQNPCYSLARKIEHGKLFYRIKILAKSALHTRRASPLFFIIKTTCAHLCPRIPHLQRVHAWGELGGGRERKSIFFTTIWSDRRRKQHPPSKQQNHPCVARSNCSSQICLCIRRAKKRERRVVNSTSSLDLA